VPAVQGVADHEVSERGGDVGALVKEDAGIASVADLPAVRGAEEGEGEVGGLREGACGRGRAVGRLGGVESRTRPIEDAKDGRGVEAPEAVKEAARGDDAAEGRAGGGGAGEVFRGVEAEEDLLQDLVGTPVRRRPDASPARTSRGVGGRGRIGLGGSARLVRRRRVKWSGRRRRCCCDYGLGLATQCGWAGPFD
jgi:hypothetical protein